MNKQKLIELRCKAWGITEDEYYCNQCSDFSLEDMARAYRRGKNKGARDKAIQNVGFYQKQMQDIYDKKNTQIAELETRCNELFLQTCEQAEKIKELKEELKDANEKVVHLACKQNKDLKKENAKLKRIVKMVAMINKGIYTNEGVKAIYEEAEQFLNEVEKCGQ